MHLLYTVVLPVRQMTHVGVSWARELLIHRGIGGGGTRGVKKWVHRESGLNCEHKKNRELG